MIKVLPFALINADEMVGTLYFNYSFYYLIIHCIELNYVTECSGIGAFFFLKKVCNQRQYCIFFGSHRPFNYGTQQESIPVW